MNQWSVGVAPVQTARALAALPAAGAWDAAPTEMNCQGMAGFVLYLSYERGAVGGAVDWQVQYSPRSADVAGVVNWYTEGEEEIGALVAGTEGEGGVQSIHHTYTAQSGNAEGVVYGPLNLSALGAERVRVRARESGVAGTPGDAGIIAKFTPGGE